LRRRLAHVILLFAGLAPAVWAICVFRPDPRRAAVLAALAVIGLGLNGVALAKPGFGIRTPLRVIACGVALILLAGVMAMWTRIQTEYLPGLERPLAADAARVQLLRMAAGNLLWITAATAYVALTLFVLPKPAKKPAPAADQTGKRIDFHQFGR